MLAVWYPTTLLNQPTGSVSDLVVYGVAMLLAFALGAFSNGRRLI